MLVDLEAGDPEAPNTRRFADHLDLEALLANHPAKSS
jgi:hypothetical protein